ncbi:hypothetical protein SeLEV6574_g08000 [Synchytrium endobioticum]|uniref:ATPase AAA-type core domain-containing protein n=1 Tax=Synchytrium endobioticum TaxID=286115 RepID=A0A507CFU5_9FUNG|nr:hypothetical protein SeLEV6574_g08000 [Synchytrium endobioticum]
MTCQLKQADALSEWLPNWLPVDASRTKRKGDSNSPLKQKKKKPRFCTSRTSNINSTKNSKSRPSTVSSTKSNKRKGRKRQSQTTDALTDFDDTAAGFEAHVEHTIVNDNDDDFQPELVLRSKRKTQKLTKPKSSQGQEEVVLQQSASSSSNTITCISHEPDFALARRLSMIDPGSSSTPPSPNGINDGKVDRNVTGTSVKKSLVFIEDADVVFEQDKTFWAAISTLIETTKIPIILTCTINPISYDNECARPIATLEKHIAPLYVSRSPPGGRTVVTSREGLEKCDGQPRLTPSKDFPRNMVTSVPTFCVDSIHKDSLEYLTYCDNGLGGCD